MKHIIKTTGKYILDKKGNIKEVDDLLTWGKWFETGDRIIRKTQIIKGIKIGKKALGIPVKISTVFLRIDHSFGGPVPILFETMIFGGKEDGYQERYATKKEALIGHNKAIELVKNH